MAAQRRTDPTTLVDTGGVKPLELQPRERRGRLVLLVGAEEGRSYDVVDGTVIGRGESADVQLVDPTVSRVHARFHRVDGGFHIEDQGSRNGTLVDGSRIDRVPIRHGARIQLGPRRLLLFSVLDVFEEAMLQAQQIDLMAKMSAGFSHDFNNLLCTMTANAAHLRELPHGMSLGHLDVRECLDDLNLAANEGAELTKRLEPFALSASSPDEPLNLSALASETIGALRQTLPRDIQVREHVQSALWVHGREPALRDLLMHPFLNARDAMPDGGVLTCEIAHCARDELPAEPILAADGYAVLRVRDSGMGMSGSELARAFDPFFTTKQVAVGRGLGLSIVRKIAHDLGGTAVLESEAGVGTTLSVVLPAGGEPRAQTDADGGEGAGQRERGRRGRATMDARAGLVGNAPLVLVVDDNDGVRRVVARALQRAGYRTEEACDGVEALERYDADGGVAAVILDLDMPRMDGRTCLAELRRRAEKLPIILLSGLVDQAVALREGELAPDVVLKKPIDPIRLLAGLEAALREQGSGR
ncbi:MAG: response regulator [Myxococcales bacterium]|nr:response regulator [Myxococcales bacterium]